MSEHTWSPIFNGFGAGHCSCDNVKIISKDEHVAHVAELRETRPAPMSVKVASPTCIALSAKEHLMKPETRPAPCEIYHSRIEDVECPHCKERNDLTETFGYRGEAADSANCDSCGKDFRTRFHVSVSVTTFEGE